MAAKLKAEQRLGLESRERLIARVVFEAIWELDHRTDSLTWDAGVGPIFGHERAEIVPHASWWEERVHPDDFSRVRGIAEKAFASGAPGWSAEYRFRRKDGSWAWAATRVVIERDAGGRPLRSVGSMIDVTRMKEAELRLQLLAGQIPGRVMAVDRDLRVIWEVGGVFGDGRPLVGRTLLEIAERHPARERIIEAYRNALAGRSDRMELRLRDRIVELHVEPLREAGEVVGAIAAGLDVTERARAESALRESQRMLLEAQRIGQVRAWEEDLRTGIVKTELPTFLGPGELPHDARPREESWRTIHPDDAPRLMEMRRRLLETGGRVETEFRMVRPDGVERMLFVRGELLRDAAGKPQRIVGTALDVTERKQVEDELARRAREQEAIAQLSLSALRGEGLQPLFDEAAALVLRTLDLEYAAVLEWVPEKSEMAFRAGAGPWTELVRTSSSRTAPGLMAWFYMHSETPVVVAELAKETRFAPCDVLLGMGVKSGIAVPIPGKSRRFGVLEANSTRSRAFTTDEVNFVWSMANVLATSIEQQRDAAELREKREKLQALSRKLISAQEAERRAVARELHDDFGQVLTAIRLNLSRRAGDPVESIALVDGALERMRDLAQDLRPPLLDELGLEASLRWYAAREARRAGLALELAFEPLAHRPAITLEATAFRVAQEALTNVIRHAQARHVVLAVRTRGEKLELEVCDDGKGFDVGAARRRSARGESQGLLGMEERVALAGGEMAIDSAAGHGTTIRVRFPLGGSRA